MKALHIILVVGLAFLTQAAPTDHPVCIVGAGPAGLTAANELESKGRKTIIFEKQAKVGGKCQAYYDNDTYHPLGALLFTNITYRETLKIINTVDVPAVPFTDGSFQWEYDWTNGIVQAAPAITTSFESLLAQEIAKYTAFWEAEFAPTLVSVGYKNGVPQDLTISTAEWLAQNGYQALPVVFNEGMVAYGYGDLRQVPILYMLQYFAPDILLGFAHVQPGYLIDFHKVWTRFAQRFVKGPILLDTSICSIDRSGTLPIINYTSAHSGFGSKPQSQTCSALILAFPPTLSALQAAHLDITTEEELVFSPVGINNYYSGAVRMATPPKTLFGAASAAPNLPPDADGEPVAFISLFNTSNIATTWSWAAYRTDETLEQARLLLKRTLSKVNKNPADPNASPVPVTDDDVRAFRKWDYFPHFDSAQLAAGWYGKFDALQGQKKTYFASGLNAFETVEFAVRAGLDVVDSYF